MKSIGELSKVNRPEMSWMEPGLRATILGGPDVHWWGQARAVRPGGMQSLVNKWKAMKRKGRKAGQRCCGGRTDSVHAWWWWWFSCSVVSDSYDPMTVAHQAPLSVGLSRQESCSGVPLPSPGDLPCTGIELRSAALQVDSLLTELWGKPSFHTWKPKEREGVVRSLGLGAEPPPPGFVATLTDTLEAGEWPGDQLEAGKLSAGQHSVSADLTAERPSSGKGCCWTMKRRRDSWPPEEKNLIRGQRRGLITQSFCVITFY